MIFHVLVSNLMCHLTIYTSVTVPSQTIWSRYANIYNYSLLAVKTINF